MKRLLQLILFVPFLIFAQPDSEGVYFNGENNYITVPDSDNINKTKVNNRTYEMYFKVENTVAGKKQILMKEGAGIRGVIFYLEGDYLIVGAYNNTDKDYKPKWKGTFYRTKIKAEEWYHVALVIDDAKPANNTSNKMEPDANKALRLYLDGELIAEQSGYQLGGHNTLRLGYKNEQLLFPSCDNWTSSSTGLSEYCFGSLKSDNNNNDYYFKGNIWGFRVWNIAMTETLINKYKETIITDMDNMPLLAVLDGDTMSYLSSGNGGVKFTSLNNQLTRTWKTSAMSSSWNDASNWEAETIPNSKQLESVKIPSDAANYPVIETHIKVGSITLQKDAKIQITETGTLDVHYDLKSEGQIKVNNNGSLLIREGELDKAIGDDEKSLYVKGKVLIDRTTPAYPADYYSYWTSPMLESQSKIGNFFTNPIRAYKWDISEQPGKWVEIGKDDVMQSGVGYSIRSDNDAGPITRTFYEEINNGDIYSPVYDYENDEDFNLIGNPYSSALNWEAVYYDNEDVVDGAIYFWRQTYMGPKPLASDYIKYSVAGSVEPDVTGYIGTGQAFFVQGAKNGNIVFKNCHRVAGNNSQFFKISDKKGEDRVWLRLSAENDTYCNKLLAYLPKATDDYDKAYEAVAHGEGINLYSILGDKKLAIQARASLNSKDEDVIPLGFAVVTAGNYSISILKSEFNEGYDILLEDKEQNTITNLREKDYNFSLDSAITNDTRFLLHIKKQVLSTVSEKLEEKVIKSYFKNNTLYTTIVDDSLTVDGIEIYDVSGKTVLKTKYKPSIQLKVSSGVYLVKYKLKERGFVVNKLIFK